MFRNFCRLPCAGKGLIAPRATLLRPALFTLGVRTQHQHSSQSPLQRYDELVATKKIRNDDHQRSIVGHLETLHQRLKTHTPITPATTSTSESGGFFSRFFGKKKSEKKEELPGRGVPNGLYLYGDVGTGKTFLMDLFYDSCTFTSRRKRIHFHNFMLDVHDRIHKIRKENATEANQFKSPDPIPILGRQLAKEAWLLCFDEFQVTDIADAMILHRLFQSLFENGIVLVTTSNRVPQDLYQGGLQRVLFLPFIDLLVQKVSVHNLDSGIDYRLTGNVSTTVFHTPINEQSKEEFESLFNKLTRGKIVEERTINHQSRKIYIPAGTGDGVARFRFADLCEKAMGAGDYNVICRNYHTIFISDIPKMSLSQKTAAKRFIILVDTMYESKTKMICLAEEKPEMLFSHDPNQFVTHSSDQDLLDALNIQSDNITMFTGQEEVFQFARCVSRLKEMQTDGYLQANRSHTLSE